jgi:hypothetical protein
MPSPIQFFNFPPPMNYGNLKHATMELSRDGFLIPCWRFAKLAKLMRPLNSTANFQGRLGQASLRLPGRLFKRQVMNYLNGIDPNGDLSIRGLSYSGQMNVDLSWSHSTFREPTVIDRIKNAVKHPITVSGLQRIQRWLQLHRPSADLRPKKTKPLRFNFFFSNPFQCALGTEPNVAL